MIFESLSSQGWTIALAHTQDDLFENILMRLARGTSPISARGMSENHGPYWRPLLDHSKAELIKWLNEYKILWKEDSSNKGMNTVAIRYVSKLFPLSLNFIPGVKII